MTERDIRQITDARVLAAMAHPLRWRLIDVLKVDGPATASRLAEATGQAVANVSHHLKVLAGAELIAEAPELARDRRERWWRLVSAGTRWRVADFDADPAGQAVALAATSLSLDRHTEQVRAWFAADAEQRASWAEGPFTTDKWLRMTPGELTELGRQLRDLLDRWADREVPEDGQQRRTVSVFAAAVPATP